MDPPPPIPDSLKACERFARRLEPTCRDISRRLLIRNAQLFQRLFNHKDMVRVQAFLFWHVFFELGGGGSRRANYAKSVNSAKARAGGSSGSSGGHGAGGSSGRKRATTAAAAVDAAAMAEQFQQGARQQLSDSKRQGLAGSVVGGMYHVVDDALQHWFPTLDRSRLGAVVFACFAPLNREVGTDVSEAVSTSVLRRKVGAGGGGSGGGEGGGGAGSAMPGHPGGTLGGLKMSASAPVLPRIGGGGGGSSSSSSSSSSSVGGSNVGGGTQSGLLPTSTSTSSLLLSSSLASNQPSSPQLPPPSSSSIAFASFAATAPFNTRSGGNVLLGNMSGASLSSSSATLSASGSALGTMTGNSGSSTSTTGMEATTTTTAMAAGGALESVKEAEKRAREAERREQREAAERKDPRLLSLRRLWGREDAAQECFRSGVLRSFLPDLSSFLIGSIDKAVNKDAAAHRHHHRHHLHQAAVSADPVHNVVQPVLPTFVSGAPGTGKSAALFHWVHRHRKCPRIRNSVLV